MIEFRAEHFSLDFENEKKWYQAVTDFNMHIDAGEMVALIGESGCGKSITALSMMGLQPPNTRIMGHMYLNGENGQEDLNELTKKEWTSIRGKRISMIFQEPMTALNPLIKVGKQVRECLLTHQKGISKKEAKSLVLEQLKSVGLPDVEDLYECYPHQLSGGQRQRVMIAMAFINNPALLIADVESGPVDEILTNPLHPYTKGLVEAIPDITKRGKPLKAIPGSVPGLYARNNTGCGFAERCEYCTNKCQKEVPPLVQEDGRAVACWNKNFDSGRGNTHD